MTAPSPAPRRRILVAMSGGVDSSVTAALLVEAGHEVIGVTMKTFCYEENEGPSKTCCGLDGIQDARRVADHLGIPHYVFDVEEDFTRDVIDDFVSEYARGRTPNPCVRCNSNTKFRDLLRRGRVLGCDGIATGHYVRIGAGADGEPSLFRGLDREKDQAYFLWGLPKEILPLLHFPLGALTKAEVRARARALHLATAEKPESQEICFVPAGDYRDLLKRRLPQRHPALEPGRIVTSDGTPVGTHDGYSGFTVGQRKGLGGGFAEPHFVLEIRPSTREVVVGPLEELVATGMLVEELNWHTTPLAPGDVIQVQFRHRAEAVPATIVAMATGSGPDFESGLDSGGGRDSGPEVASDWGLASESGAQIRFVESQRAVTPGQSAVFFQGDRVLGGGRVSRVYTPTAPLNT